MARIILATPEGKGGIKTIRFKPAQPVSAAVASVISSPMKRLTIDVPIDPHIRLKTGCAMRGEKIADVVRAGIPAAAVITISVMSSRRETRWHRRWM